MHKMSKKVVQLTQIVKHQNDHIEELEMALAQRPAEEARLHAFVQDFLANYRHEMEQVKDRRGRKERGMPSQARRAPDWYPHHWPLTLSLSLPTFLVHGSGSGPC
jgi:hypothetical protein